MSTKSSLQSLLTHALARSLTSLGLTACRLKMPYTALCGIPMRLKMSGALIPVLLRAITLQRCRIVLRDFLWQYQYYCIFCLVKHIVGSNLKSKNQEVSGFSDQWVLNVKVDFNEISHECLPTLQFESTKFSRNLKKSKFENFHIKKKCHYFCTGVFSQKPKLIRSVVSDGLTNIYKRRVSLDIYKKGANKFGRKIGFEIENESEDQNQSSPKLKGTLTVRRCIFGLIWWF